MQAHLLDINTLLSGNNLSQPIKNVETGYHFLKPTGENSCVLLKIAAVHGKTYEVEAYTIETIDGQIVIRDHPGLTQIKYSTLIQGWMTIKSRTLKTLKALIASKKSSGIARIKDRTVVPTMQPLVITGYDHPAFTAIGQTGLPFVGVDAKTIAQVKAISFVPSRNGLNIFLILDRKVKGEKIRVIPFTGKVGLTTDGINVQFQRYSKPTMYDANVVMQGLQTPEIFETYRNNGFINQLFGLNFGRIWTTSLETVKAFGLTRLFQQIFDVFTKNAEVNQSRVTLVVDVKDPTKVMIGLSDGNTSRIINGIISKFGFQVESYENGLPANAVNIRKGLQIADAVLIADAKRMFMAVEHNYVTTRRYGIVSPVLFQSLMYILLKQTKTVKSKRSRRRDRTTGKKSGQVSSQPITKLPTDETRELIGAAAPTGAFGSGTPNFDD